MGTAKPQLKEIVGFHFQEIPLDEAVNAVIAGDGNYAGIKATILEKIPQIEAANADLPQNEKKSFAFGLPNEKEVPEDQRRGICKAINMTLKKAKMSWRVTYSGVKKLFVCIPPAAPRTYEKKSDETIPGYTPRSKFNKTSDMDEAIFALRKSGMSVSEISKKGFPIQRVSYLCYQKFPKKTKAVEPPSVTPSIDTIETVACKLFGVPAVQLQGARINRDLSKVRKAIMFIAARKYHYRFKALAKHFGLAEQSLWGINGDAEKIPDHIKRLTAAI